MGLSRPFLIILRRPLSQEPCPCSKSPQGRERLVIFRTVTVMVTILFAVASIFVFRFRSRAAFVLKVLALQHQLAVLRRQSDQIRVYPIEPCPRIAMRKRALRLACR